MKKIKWLLFLLTFIVIIFYFAEYQGNFLTGQIPNNKVLSGVGDEGQIKIYFCPREDCEEKLVSFIDSAQQSLHCALFEIGLKSVQEKLLEKSKVIDVKIVTDDQYLKKFNYSFVKADKYGLMHNKFCVVDGEKFSGGSMNPTDNDTHKNNNNLLLVGSKILAQNYEEEFQEMWRGQFKKGDSVRNPVVRLGNITIENYFCPEDHCAEQVEKELKKAQKSIYFMTFSFTHEGIANEILLKHLEDLEIRGVLELKQISEYSQFEVLQYQGVKVRKDGNKYNLHHKVFIIDGETVVTGSFNPTAGGDENNDENLLVIHDKAIAQKFTEEFEKVWKEAETT